MSILPTSDSRICLYSKTGGDYCLTSTRRSLSEIDGIDARRIIVVDNDMLCRMSNDEKATLVVPGGSTLTTGLNMRKMCCGVRIIDDIRGKVKSGWNYFGLCAGANIACCHLVSTAPCIVKGPHTIRQYHKFVSFLNLLPVSAIHNFYLYDPYPLDDGLCPDNYPGTVAQININTQVFPLYWNQGSYFDIFDETDIEVIARYEDVEGTPPAMVAGSFGKGSVLLTQVHPEIDATDPVLFDLAKQLNHYPYHNNDNACKRLRNSYDAFFDTKVNRINLLRDLCIRVGIISAEVEGLKK